MLPPIIARTNDGSRDNDHREQARKSREAQAAEDDRRRAELRAHELQKSKERAQAKQDAERALAKELEQKKRARDVAKQFSASNREKAVQYEKDADVARRKQEADEKKI